MSDRAPAVPADEGLDLDEIEEGEIPEDDETGVDAGGDEDATDEDGEGEEAEESDVDPAPRRGGGAATPRTLRRRAQEAERALVARDAEIAELRRGQQEIQQRLASDPQAAQRAEQEWLANLELMSPSQQAQAVIERGRREFGGALRGLQQQNADQIDRLSYDAAARTSPLHQRHAARVEEIHAAELRQGRVHPREAILDNLIGREVREKAGRAAPAQRRQANGRVQRQTTRPGAARGDASGGRGRRNDDSIEATRERLKGQPLW
jgi:hypothetical protein